MVNDLLPSIRAVGYLHFDIPVFLTVKDDPRGVTSSSIKCEAHTRLTL